MKKLIYRLFLAVGIIVSSLGFSVDSAEASKVNPSDISSVNIAEQKPITETENLTFSDVMDQQMGSGTLVSGHYSHRSHSSHSSHRSHYSSRY